MICGYPHLWNPAVLAFFKERGFTDQETMWIWPSWDVAKPTNMMILALGQKKKPKMGESTNS